MRTPRTSRRHKRYKLKSEINVVPYIDVMLVLLIIFMVTTPMINASVDVNLPQADAKALHTKNEPLIVEVDHDGNFCIKKDKDCESVSADQLKVEIGAIVKQNPDISVLVAGDQSGKYNGVYQALTDLQQAGVSKVGLMSTPESGKPNARP
ncbi:protein TolR [Rhodanobacter sp. 115]|uniref:protein TolR n=1 Tax=Rhodanobacter sp. FW021-MT20 TaxID=1162282 RepID=UPI000260D6DA|nr:protein TolR [Rhodanobacter sp. 115]EIL96285.1 TolR protein [Rhodanobacter sp. 115]